MKKILLSMSGSRWVAAAVALGFAGTIRSAEPEPPASAVTRVGAAWLVRDAWQTQARHVRATRSSEGDVPPELWGDALKELKPVRVYCHRVNVVAALRTDGQTEEGLYISIPISSFIPTAGTDGFEYTPVAREVLAYRRSLSPSARGPVRRLGISQPREDVVQGKKDPPEDPPVKKALQAADKLGK